MFARIAVILLVFALGSSLARAQGGPAPQLPPQPKSRPAAVPANAILISPCVQGMGEHWATLKDLPVGPIYGTYKGKVVFSEIMIDQKAFAAGKSYRDTLKPLPGYRIDHVDVEFEPKGHEGYPIPHYDIHAYYVTHEIHSAFCPEGVPNLTGK